jgi:putative flippase GtrA
MASKYTPTPKVAAGGASGAVVVILVWLASLVGLDVPAEVAGAAAVLIGFAAAWLTPDASTAEHRAEASND